MKNEKEKNSKIERTKERKPTRERTKRTDEQIGKTQ
jgi:hypothetical protein